MATNTVEQTPKPDGNWKFKTAAVERFPKIVATQRAAATQQYFLSQTRATQRAAFRFFAASLATQEYQVADLLFFILAW